MKTDRELQEPRLAPKPLLVAGVGAAVDCEIECPFCDEKGFDKEGLKYHLETWCKEYEQIIVT